MRRHLSFTTPFVGALAGTAVPVEIRTTGLALVGVRDSHEGAWLDPGTYVVKALLPAGQEIVRVVEVEDEDVEVALTVDAEESSPRESLEIATYTASPRALRESQAPDLGRVFERGVFGRMIGGLFSPPRTSSAPRGWLQCVEGNALRENAVFRSEMQPQIEKTTDKIAVVEIPPAETTMYLQCVQPDRPVLNLALPVSGKSGCTAFIRREAKRYWIEVQLANPAASMLLGYRQNRALELEAHTAEMLLRDKMVDPIGAAVAAYSLLTFGQLSRLHDWTDNLMKWMPWLPDGAAIRGEHLARLAEHREAIDAFLLVGERGLPIFSDGISMTYERLRLYLRMKNLAWDAGKREAAERLLARLDAFMGVVDFNQTLTVFTGRNVTQPDEEPVAKPDVAGAAAIHYAFV